MGRKLLVATLLSAAVVTASAQDARPADTLARNTIFVEIGGASAPVSINYDYHVLPRRLSARVGLTYLPVFSDALVSFPVNISGLYRLPHPDMYFEGSAGLTPVITPAELALYPTATLTARIQPASGGYFLRLGYTWWTPRIFERQAIGVSIGYTFSGP